jgi:thiol-disulfide isomerase/thioredoxin
MTTVPKPPTLDSSKRIFLKKTTFMSAAFIATTTGAWLGLKNEQKNRVSAHFWQTMVEDLQGKPWNLSRLQGKPLIINFWATWCPPCVHELPEIEKFHFIWGSKGWQVLGLALDSPKAVHAFLQKNSLQLPIAINHQNGLNTLRLLQNTPAGLPCTALISAEGDLIKIKNGPTTFLELQDWAHAHTGLISS